MNTNKAINGYEVLSPWADADPKPVKGISPRVTALAGKKIGLFCNSKRAARPVATAVADKLKARFPDIETSWYSFTRVSIPEIETNKEKFEAWIRGVDAVIAAVGD